MTNSAVTSSEDLENELTAESVIDWLAANPGFLENHPEAVDMLKPPREDRGKNVTDFQGYLMDRLRADRDEVVESARAIVETSRENMSNQARMQTAVLMLLDAMRFEDFVQTITMDFAPILGVDIVSILVETDGEIIPHITLPGVRVVVPGSVGALTEGQAVKLESNIYGDEALYGGGAGLVSSQALLPLYIAEGVPPALIAFGSREPEFFAPGQGTELLSFLGGVTERCFRRWLNMALIDEA